MPAIRLVRDASGVLREMPPEVPEPTGPRPKKPAEQGDALVLSPEVQMEAERIARIEAAREMRKSISAPAVVGEAHPCLDCGFVTRSAAGLAAHRAAKHRS